MKFTILVSLAAAISATLGADTAAQKPISGTYLHTTALVTKNNASAFECWRIANPFTTSTGAGTSGASTLGFANLANLTYTVIPSRFEGGVHNAPHNQLVQFMSGVVVLSIPGTSQSAYVVGGADGLIIAADTTGVGHNTSYPSNVETRALQIPFANGTLPTHTVVNQGPCKVNSQVVTY